ncbi:MAG: NADPH-dependent F420 reductase [Chloroflexi bacterium]|nr:NADPH-dependent F420 reductase [Chloroflexota bacterium]OJV97537.1 MAG: NADPH-dependent F420 reductase [Chloroflexi bacterium 54-19]
MPGTIGILGGTGQLGSGLALRLGQAGYKIIIGSRSKENAEKAVEKLKTENPGLNFDLAGTDNKSAAGEADLVILTVHYEHLVDLLAQLKSEIAGKIVVSTINPLTFAGGKAGLLPVEANSVAELIQQHLPEAKVTAAFNTISAALLSDTTKILDEDILVAGDDKAARAEVAGLVNAIPGLKGVEAGPLRYAKVLEEMILLIISLNRLHKAQTGFRVTGI